MKRIGCEKFTQIKKIRLSQGEKDETGIMNNNNYKGTGKTKLKYPLERVYIVNESYAGKKELSELFADLLCSEYFRRDAHGSEPKRLHGGRP